jgi:uncharacterized protein
MKALLDVNVLISLFDPASLNHEAAHEWFARHQRYGWATSSITIAGCVRVLSHPAYPTVKARPEEVVSHLRQLCQSPNHQHWDDTTSLVDPNMFRPEFIGGHQKITDALLLALACQHEGRLVTFDRAIPVKAVVGATRENLLVLGPRSVKD